jgi:hypothetical protein
LLALTNDVLVPDNTAPVLLRVVKHIGQAALTRFSPVFFNFTASEAITGVSSSLITTAGSTASIGAISVTALSATDYRVQVAVTGVGSVVVGFSAPAGVKDLALNNLAATGLTASLSFGELCACPSLR